MMGRRNRDQGQLFYEFHLDEAVPDDHLVRKIKLLLDLSWVYGELAPYLLGDWPTAPRSTGRAKAFLDTSCCHWKFRRPEFPGADCRGVGGDAPPVGLLAARHAAQARGEAGVTRHRMRSGLGHERPSERCPDRIRFCPRDRTSVGHHESFRDVPIAPERTEPHGSAVSHIGKQGPFATLPSMHNFAAEVQSVTRGKP